MLPHVEKPLVVGGESFSTHHTFIWLVFWMVGAEMKFQGSKVRILFPTVLTTMETASFVQSLVLLIHFIAAEVSITDLTGLLRLLSSGQGSLLLVSLYMAI